MGALSAGVDRRAGLSEGRIGAVKDYPARGHGPSPPPTPTSAPSRACSPSGARRGSTPASRTSRSTAPAAPPRRRALPRRFAAPPKAPAEAAAPDVAAAIALARELAAAAPDLAALEAAIAAFEGCPLKSRARAATSFARGAADAPVVIVGEGPGAEEDLQGAPVRRPRRQAARPHAGGGGPHGAGCSSPNTVFWRPPGNRTPFQAEQMICAPFVERALALIQPKQILLVGRHGGQVDAGARGRHPQSSRPLVRMALARRDPDHPGDADAAPGLSAATAGGQEESLARSVNLYGKA
ncbi:MAG: uracil-DNA glycosylase family protein [Caulobacteraceae bacterium]